MRLFVVRHGETIWNAEGRFQGQIDTELNSKGVTQAEAIAKRLANHPFQGILATPLSRAHITASMIADSCGFTLSVKQIPAFTEINHGDWEGLLADEVREHWPGMLDQWHTAPHLVTMPGEGGENLEMLHNRVITGLEELLQQHHGDGDYCLVSHDAVIKVLMCHVLGSDLSYFWRFQVGNCSLSIIDFKVKTAPRVSLFGDTSFISNSFHIAEQKGL